MPSDSSNFEMWSHYQTQQLGVFAASKTRLDFLIGVAEKFTGGRTLLNIGSGDGYLERTAAQRNWTVISLDPDPKTIQRLKTFGLDARCGVIESVPVEPRSVDVVICTEVFEHLSMESLESGLDEIRRVLKPDGLLIGTVPYREDLAENQVFCPDCKKCFHRWGHLQSFNESAMHALISRYLHVRKVKPLYLPAWQSTDWKGKLSLFARLAFASCGIHSSESYLFFVAAKSSCNDDCTD
jgi:SAM-dependent methyltransferase